MQMTGIESNEMDGIVWSSVLLAYAYKSCIIPLIRWKNNWLLWKVTRQFHFQSSDFTTDFSSKLVFCGSLLANVK